MNIIETRQGGYLFTLKSHLSKSIKREYNKTKKNNNNTAAFFFILFLGILFFPILSTYPLLLKSIVVGGFSFMVGRYFYFKKKLNKVSLSISEASIGFNTNIGGVSFKKHFSVEQFDQLYIKKTDINQFTLFIILNHGKRATQYPLLVGDKNKVPELTDLKDQIHEFYGIKEDLFEGEHIYNELKEPKRKRQFFKIFDQNVNDIRKNGVLTIAGKDHLVSTIEQIDWQTGLSSFQFQIEELFYLYFHFSSIQKYIIKERKLSEDIDILNFHLTSDVINLPQKVEVNAITFYQNELNKGLLYNEKNTYQIASSQAIYEDTNGEFFLRIVEVDSQCQAYIGQKVEEYQLEEILPEVEE